MSNAIRVESGQKVALVTGGSGGLGGTLARKLAGARYAVAVHYHSREEEAAARVAEVTAEGGKARAFGGNLDGEEGACSVVNGAAAWGGRLDAVINCSGTYTWAPNEKLTEAQWFLGLNSTASAAFFVARAAMPHLRRAGHGRLVNIGDSGADRPTARDHALGYHVGKVGVLMITRSIAKAEAANGITCNMVSPGYLENSVDISVAPKMPSGRIGTFEDIWVAVEFLLKPETAYLTGSNLVVSGGWNLR
jgi:3-oxoacyl-[acyl-carrier protein] reductase